MSAAVAGSPLLPAGYSPELIPARRAHEVDAGQWQQLATRAAEANAYFEPWALLPALQAFADADIQLLVVRQQTAGTTESLLVGLCPISSARAGRLPVNTRSVWIHPECYLGTPLVDSAHVNEVMLAISATLTDGAIGRLPLLHSGGPCCRAMIDAVQEAGFELSARDRHTRALCEFGAAPDADSYLERAISHKHRKEQRRQWNRLADMQAQLVELDDGGQLPAWIEEFIALEAAGWKGGAGAALALDQRRSSYFRELCARAWPLGRLQFQALRVGGRAIAMKCNLLAPPGAFAYKICFDELLAKYSPGTHLELFNVSRLFAARPTLQWMDSCASRRRWLVDRMWSERRAMETLVIARSISARAALLHLAPLMLCLRRFLQPRHRDPQAADDSH